MNPFHFPIPKHCLCFLIKREIRWSSEVNVWMERVTGFGLRCKILANLFLNQGHMHKIPTWCTLQHLHRIWRTVHPWNFSDSVKMQSYSKWNMKSTDTLQNNKHLQVSMLQFIHISAPLACIKMANIWPLAPTAQKWNHWKLVYRSCFIVLVTSVAVCEVSSSHPYSSLPDHEQTSDVSENGLPHCYSIKKLNTCFHLPCHPS